MNPAKRNWIILGIGIGFLVILLVTVIFLANKTSAPHKQPPQPVPPPPYLPPPTAPVPIFRLDNIPTWVKTWLT